MKMENLELAANRARVAELPTADPCSFYRAVRVFFHEMDKKTGRLDPSRYVWKAGAGLMTRIIERSCSHDVR